MAKRLGHAIMYHGRAGRPVLHQTAKGRKYIMVRAPGGGVMRLYEGSKYRVTREGARPAVYKRLEL